MNKKQCLLEPVLIVQNLPLPVFKNKAGFRKKTFENKYILGKILADWEFKHITLLVGAKANAFFWKNLQNRPQAHHTSDTIQTKVLGHTLEAFTIWRFIYSHCHEFIK